MGVKVCIVDGCWQPTPNTRCAEHEREWQRARNARRGRGRTPTAPYRRLSLAGHVCACCGSAEDLTRHHVDPVARGQEWAGGGVILPMCRRCNSSIGVHVMEGYTCPMHGGVIAGG